MIEQAMMLIVHSGNARSLAMESMAEAKVGNFAEAQKLMTECDEAGLEAHKIQTDLIQKEAQGESIELTLLMVHAQDHLMTSLVVKDLAKEFIDLYKKIG